MAARARLVFSLFGLLFTLASPAAAVSIDWVPIGNAGNAADTTGRGAVSYNYFISKYEVTNAQYAEFLNAKAASDPLGLWNASMSSDTLAGGITRSGVSGSYTYAAKAGFVDKPVVYVSLFDSMRFSNWLNNGQGSSSTETGAYTLLGGTAQPTNWQTVVREAVATTFLTSQDEWYKAAYYNGSVYFTYPAGSNTVTTCANPTASPNNANCYRSIVPSTTDKGAYSGSASPYGTFDQGGNAQEYTDSFNFAYLRIVRGGSAGYDVSLLAKTSAGLNWDPNTEGSPIGFRVASLVPEPGTGLLLGAGLTGLALRRRLHAASARGAGGRAARAR